MGAIAGCLHGDDGGTGGDESDDGDGGSSDGGGSSSDDGAGSDGGPATAEPAPREGEDYRNLSYEITEEGEDVSGTVGSIYNTGNYTLMGSLTVGPADCNTSDVVEMAVSEELAEVLVAPVGRDDAPAECSDAVVEHAFQVTFESEFNASRILLKADDYEDGEVVVYDSDE